VASREEAPGVPEGFLYVEKWIRTDYAAEENPQGDP
jgi:hypothetical protein